MNKQQQKQQQEQQPENDFQMYSTFNMDFPHEELIQPNNNYESESQKKSSEETWFDEFQPIQSTEDLQEEYDNCIIQIEETILKLDAAVEEVKNNKSLMLTGNGVNKFDECLQNQEKSKELQSRKIITILQALVYSMGKDFNQRQNGNSFFQDAYEYNLDQSFNEQQLMIKEELDFKYRFLNEKTKNYILESPQQPSNISNEAICVQPYYNNQDLQINDQQTTFIAQQQTLYLKVDEVYKKLKPEIINKINELTTEVDSYINDQCLMSKGNGVQKFDQCLEDQEQSKQHFFQQIFQKLDEKKFQAYNPAFIEDFYDENEAIKLINRNLDFAFSSLTKKTNECKLACQKVHAYQKRVPEQIPSIIEEILQEPNIQANNTIRKIQAQARKVKPFIKKCFKPNSKDESKKVLQMKSLKQKLTSNQLKKIIKLITLLKKNQHSLKFRDQNFSEEDIKDILDKFNNHINTMIKNKFYTMNGRSKKIQKIKNNSKIP